uniref:NADH-ubiquinone oxidoreductase chain 5 n=1 Tax=Leucoptera malifoliella TaxID=753488 RepID=J7F297_9NEOP|nr:NADH dehydrogenase subunit 5 [Leucoptera malifoliella]AER38734.1 NADH dehydrogenase subunit 5 [Leucoptera malifoliella]
MCLKGFYFLLLLFFFFFFFFLFYFYNETIIFIEWEIISFNSNMIVMSILIDWMSLLFMSFVLLISSVVIMYSEGYMSSDKNLIRFIILVLLFVLSMMLLIISPNLISILLGWDGLGLISFCLVIYYQSFKSYNSGMLTVLSNRVGDVFILICISWMMNYGSWNYFFYLNFMKSDFSMIMLSYLIILAAMTKSAQIPFSSWLPAAMAAPTPVSALVHSSTLVTAGVYLLIRFSELLMNSLCFKMLLLISSLTMFMAGIAANYEFDLKKIIAFSTLSQLGLMMSILCIGFPKLAFFHLLTHAMFKALLFMCAGMIIHILMDIQDIRYMGSLSNFIPLTSLCFNISNLSLCGIPFLSGFYSKDMVLEMFFMTNFNLLIYLLMYMSTGLTMFYTIRLLFYLMINEFNLISIYNLMEENYIMIYSMMVLLIMSLISGSVLNWMIFYDSNFIYMSMYMKLMVVYVSMIGMILGYFISLMKWNLISKFLLTYKISFFFSSMWFLVMLSTYSLSLKFLNFNYKSYKNIDLMWNEYLSGQGIFFILKNYSIYYYYFQMNNFKIYMFSFIIWFFFIYLFMMMINY